MSPTRISQPPVLIVGAGPVGLIQAYMLSKLDVPVILLARHHERLGAPKAHALSPRSLEICRQFGISISKIRSHPAPRDEAKWVRFVTNLSGEEVGNLPYERMSLDVLDATPEMLHNISQPDFETMITELLEDDPNVDFRRGWSWTSAEMSSNNTFVTSNITNTYSGETRDVRSSLIIACDGANSRVRKFLGITSDSEETTETMMTMHFGADLRPVVGERKGMLHWILDPAARGFIIAYDSGGNQVLIHNFDPEHHPLESFTDDKCKYIIQKAIGRDVPFTFYSKLPWLLRRQVANDYYKGRFILAGDSAHSFPPTGGLGLNSGIADAHNLAYKVAAVQHHGADMETVFQTYQVERRPIAERNSMQSVKNGKKIFALLKALKNTNPDYDIATRQMQEALADPVQKQNILRLIEEQREHFDNLMLHIGYVYEPGWNPANATDFVPAYRKGARLPHAWIEIKNKPVIGDIPRVDLEYLRGDLDNQHIEQWKYSTLDLIGPQNFVLIADKSSADERLVGLSKKLASTGYGVKTILHGVDFTFVDAAAGETWLEEFGLIKGNVILVRPDQHIAMIVKPETQAEIVSKALEQEFRP